MLALVLGGASCVWDDVAAFRTFGVEPDATVACNDMIAEWRGSLDAACSLHADKLRGWLDLRDSNGYAPPWRTLAKIGTSRGFEEVEWKFVGQRETGSSGLFALRVALETLGAERAVLCGIPMQHAPHFFNTHPWHAYKRHWNGWLQALPQIKSRARSMSGETQRILGSPSREWLLG
jgi:hypothetical protein